MNKKQTDLFLYSSVGIIVMLVMVVLINIISGHVKTRLDLTAERLYTLSEGTKQILGELDTDVEINFYATRDDKLMPVQFKNYISHIEDLLDEYSQYSKGHLKITKFNPEPDSDAADRAAMDGVTGQMISLGESIYLGLAIKMLDKNVSIPFLDPSREKLLEYDLTRAITQVTTDDKPVLGVMSALPVFGSAPNPMMMQMGQMQQQPPWFLISQLQQDFEVRELELTADKIDSDLDLLVVIHPKDITDATQYAIDQYLMGGGKVIAFLDPLAIVDQTPSPNGNNMLGPPPSSSNMETLLSAWGYTFDTGKIAADRQFAREVSFQRGAPPQMQPGILFLDANGINTDDVVTSQIDQLLIPFAGTLSGTPAEGLEQTVLLHSSEESQMVDAFMARLSGEQILKEFKAEGKKLPLAIRLAGQFKTAFPNGKPGAEATAEDDLDKEDDAATPEGEQLKESADGATVVLFTDADFIYDNFGVSVQNFLGARMAQLLNGNFPLAQGTVEQMAGDARLISVRGRATMNRPFTRIRDMEIEAAKAYQARINDLEEQKREAEQKINDLQRSRQDGQAQSQRFVLTPEQQTELEKLRETNKQVTKDLKDMRRNLRKDIDSLQTRLKWINIAGMPFLVTVGGIFIALIKRKRTAAR